MGKGSDSDLISVQDSEQHLPIKGIKGRQTSDDGGGHSIELRYSEQRSS